MAWKRLILSFFLLSSNLEAQEFKLKEKNWLSVFTRGSGYSRENLKGDLETLESIYKNRGYLKFEILSSMVTISKDKKNP